jgi:polysaccharide export outer membrane protein
MKLGSTRVVAGLASLSSLHNASAPSRPSRVGGSRRGGSRFTRSLTFAFGLCFGAAATLLAQNGTTADPQMQQAQGTGYSSDPQTQGYDQNSGYVQNYGYGQTTGNGQNSGYPQNPAYGQNLDNTQDLYNGQIPYYDNSGQPTSYGFPSTTYPGQTSNPPGGAGTAQQQNGQTPQTNQSRYPLPPQPLTDFQRIVAESTGKILPIFGANLFNVPPSTFAPVQNIPVTPDYVIGPGDELRLQIWGQVNLRGSYVVDRTGAIALPQVGSVHVAGLRFSQITDFLRSQLGRVYRNYDLNVNLGQLRSIQVFVVGKARRPGSYTIGSLSTLLNALFVSGGPQSQGSLRDIQVRRNGETVTHFDLYDLLLRGDKTKDVPLTSGDVIFIPDVGAQVAVLGSIKSPGIYELHGEQTFQQLVALSGGQTNVAAGSRARVERISNHADRNVIDVDLKGTESPAVQDGDVVIVDSIVDRFKDAVTLRGNVANPGRYAWHPGMHVSDLIPSRESLMTRDYSRQHNLLGQANLDYMAPPREGPLGTQTAAVTDHGAAAIRGAASRGTADSETADPRTTSSGGGGGNSAGSALTGSSSNFQAKTDVILSAPDIDWDYAVIERLKADTLTTTLVPFNLGKVVLDKDRTQDLELLSGDVVTIFSKADIRVPSNHQTKFVKLEGEFAGSGIYSVEPGETLRHLLTRAGGLTPDAYLFASEFTRESVRRLERERLLEYADSLETEITAQTSQALGAALTDRDAAAAQASGAEARASLSRLRTVQPTGRIVLQLKPDSRGVAALPDLELEDGDRFVVPKVPTAVNVVGQVYSANAFVFETNRKVKDYLRLAGGPDRQADIKRSFVLRADGSVISHQYVSQRHFGNFEHLAMLPGDTIVVPPKVVRGSALRSIANIASILQGFGIAAAAVQVLK